MAKGQKRHPKNFEPPDETNVPWRRDPKPLTAKTAAQAEYIRAIRAHTLIFATGPAGTGKTYVAAAMAADALHANPDLKLILTRPVVEAGESLGFLPGTLEEKYAPYLQPFIATLEDRLGPGEVKYMLRHKRIDPQPLAFMRGSTFRDAWVILDEAQNTTPKQMKLFLTRIGENSKIIVDGDVDQADLPGVNGLQDATNRLVGVPSCRRVTFTEDDIVRHDIVRHIIQAYR